MVVVSLFSAGVKTDGFCIQMVGKIHGCQKGSGVRDLLDYAVLTPRNENAKPNLPQYFLAGCKDRTYNLQHITYSKKVPFWAELLRRLPPGISVSSHKPKACRLGQVDLELTRVSSSRTQSRYEKCVPKMRKRKRKVQSMQN